MNPAQPKVTYATMSADQMSDLHRELDAAIERVKDGFGQSHPMFIDGRAVEGLGPVIEDRSPIDTRILIGRFASATREQTQEAIAAARAAFPAWSRRPWEERVQIVRSIGRRIRERRADLSALVGYETGKSRLECVGEVEEAADFFDYYCDRMEQTDGFENLMGMPGSRRGEPERPPPVRRLRHHRAVQLPGGAGRRSDGGGAPGRQHRRLQGRRGHRAGGDSVLRGARRPRAAGRLQPRERPRRAGGPGNREQPGRGRPRLHRLDGGRAEAGPRQRVAPVPAAADHRDGRQEPRADHAQRRSRQGVGRRHAIRVRRDRPEVLGLLARLRVARGAGPVRRAARREDEEDQGRHPARPRRVDGAAHQRARAEELRERHRAGEARRRPHPDRRPADHGRAVQPRLLRRADGHRRPAARPRALQGGAVRPDHRGGRRADARRGDRPGQRDRVRPDGGDLLAGRRRRSASSSTGSRRA